jgi:hypothetical protein
VLRVTVATALQAIVLGILSRYFPDDGFIAEESSAVLKKDPATLQSVVDTVRCAISRELTAEVSVHTGLL